MASRKVNGLPICSTGTSDQDLQRVLNGVEERDAVARLADHVDNMGIGLVGDPNTIFKRKFRFIFGLKFCNRLRDVSPSFVKVASRPDIAIEETPINFLNERTWIPGKPSWETITVTYLDAAGSTNLELYNWLATVYDFSTECRKMGTKRQDYAGEAQLIMLDGCGQPLEKWVLGNVWPTSVKFGELDYSSSDICEVSLTLRYSNVAYISLCPRIPLTPCPCSPCKLPEPLPDIMPPAA